MKITIGDPLATFCAAVYTAFVPLAVIVTGLFEGPDAIVWGNLWPVMAACLFVAMLCLLLERAAERNRLMREKQKFADYTLSVLDGSPDWSSDTLQEIAEYACALGLASDEGESFRAVGKEKQTKS
jgi:hypothetical protein